MVVQRTLNKIEELKDRPHHERRTIALYWAVGVMLVLFLLWGFFAVRAVGNTAITLSNQQSAPQPAVQTASAAAALEAQEKAASKELVASSTNGYVDLIPASQ